MSELVTLVTEWEKFQLAFPKGTVSDFGTWISRSFPPQSSPASAEHFTAADPSFAVHGEMIQTSMQAGYLLIKMNQYLQVYTKAIMKKYGMHSMDDFGYLSTVQWHHSISKSKACAIMMQEVTTGVDIIKRLIRLEYLKEILDQSDKRQKLLQLTAKGQKVLDDIEQDLHAMPDVLGDLELPIRKSLVQWLMELDQYHDNLAKEKKQAGL